MIPNKATAPKNPSASARSLECLHHHNGGMSEARPCGEGDHAAIRRWVTRCQQHENPKCDIDAKKRLARFPTVARGISDIDMHHPSADR